MHGTRRRLAPLLISLRGFRMPPGNVSKRVHCGDSSPGYWGLLTTGSSVPQTPAGRWEGRRLTRRPSLP